MSLRTPHWWYRRTGAPLWRWALWPMSLLWQVAGRLKAATAKPYRARLTVISVGNATLGGSGKTPITIELLRLLGSMGVTASGLSRGYGGREAGPLSVSPQASSEAVGDEALLVARTAAMMVARDRVAGLIALEDDNEACVVDDAHQNHQFFKDISFLIVDGDTRNGDWPFGQGDVFPMGPMREPLKDALARTDVVIIWLPDATTDTDPDLLAVFKGLPVLLAHLEASPPPEGPLLAFAGIAKPWKFEQTLRAYGADLTAFHAFPDHAPLSEAQWQGLCGEAALKGAALITTEKDWVRLPETWRAGVHALDIRARFRDEASLTHLLTESLAAARHRV